MQWFCHQVEPLFDFNGRVEHWPFLLLGMVRRGLWRFVVMLGVAQCLCVSMFRVGMLSCILGSCLFFAVGKIGG